ncbi:PIN domain-containing protein [Streptomyces sp. cg28]|uniref:PIN domain-containing protein n=1 Tax=Streptomyces sp. cg28 TaxID=3403457 RepID=UPI003B21CDDB
MRRVVFDSNAIDPIVDTPGAYQALRGAVDRGELEVLYTHITIDELSAIPDLERRRRLLTSMTGLGQPVPTGVFVLDHSRLDHARLGDEAAAAALENLRSGSLKNTNDGIIASTARYEGCALVTNEARRLPNRSREEGIEVLSTSDLLAEFGFVLPDAQRPDRA